MIIQCEKCQEIYNTKEGICPYCEINANAKAMQQEIGIECNVGIKSEGGIIAEAEMAKAVADYPNNVYAKEIWNEAIEAAALIVQPKPHIDEERRCEDIASEIRKLKKCLCEKFMIQ